MDDTHGNLCFQNATFLFELMLHALHSRKIDLLHSIPST